MATTPPASRARTPPTPLHGPKFDAYEPFSPRRSSRLTKPGNASTSLKMSNSLSISSSPHFWLKSDGATLRKSLDQRNCSSELSPPVSPNSGAKPCSHAVHFSGGMLPTPVKTPRKRDVDGEAKLVTTARVLFASRPRDVDDAMPTPRRSRKGRKHTAFTLDDVDERGGNEGTIQVYTDSRDRVPEVDENEDNPFNLRRTNRKKLTSAAVDTEQIRKPKHGTTKEIDEAVRNEEGMVYVFRGKKLFRKYDDTTNSRSVSAEGPDDLDVSRHAGTVSQQRLTRSSLKPRLLFPPKESTPVPYETDEEALTDIEGPALEITSDSEDVNTTPIKQKSYLSTMTPPTTGCKTRPSMANVLGYEDLPASRARVHISPFDVWQRTKPAPERDFNGKRPGGPIEKPETGTGKRPRSGENFLR